MSESAESSAASLGTEFSESRETKEKQKEEKADSGAAPKPKLNPLSITFRKPERFIKAATDMPKWMACVLYAEVGDFILQLNEQAKGTHKSMQRHVSKSVQQLVDHLSLMKALIKDCPPTKLAVRSGNPSFRIWHEMALKTLPALLEPLLGPALHAAGATNELIGYLDGAFGHPQRLDYGTGHELAFVIFLAAIFKLGIVRVDDMRALLLDVFGTYLDLVRALQHEYLLEPAGSKGVWSLDDYQHLPFVWGAAQLIGNEEIPPSAVTDERAMAKHADEYIYLGCVAFVLKVKKGPFHEHSYYLHQASLAANWSKVNAGMLKMYQDHVLHKFPVVQHVLFGGIFPFAPGTPQQAAIFAQSSAPPVGTAASMAGVAAVRPGVAPSRIGIETVRPAGAGAGMRFEQLPPLLSHPPRAKAAVPATTAAGAATPCTTKTS